MAKESDLLKNAMNVLSRKKDKKCNKCSLILPVDNFRIRHYKKKDGTIKHYHYYDCKKCEANIIAKWMKTEYDRRRNNSPSEHELHLSNSRNSNKKSRDKGTNELADWYMRRVLDMTMDEVKKNPELVEAKRAQIRLKRKADEIIKNKR